MNDAWTGFTNVIARVNPTDWGSFVGLDPESTAKILWTLVACIAYFVIRRAFSSIIARRVRDMTRQYVLRKTLNYVLGFFGLVAVIKIWLGGLGGLATYFGILSAGIAIALREPLANLAGWAFIAVRKPFIVGDRIEVGECAGDVIDLRLFEFSLVEIGNWVDADQSTGRILHVPNGAVFSKPIANYTQGFNFVWNEISVVVTFESHWERAKQVLTEIANDHSAIQSEYAAQQVRRAARKFLIFFQHLTPIVWTSVADHGVELTIRYLCEPRKRRSSEAAIWEAVLTAFAESDDIDFAYPTQRFYNNVQEGKRTARRDRPPERSE